MVGFSGLQFFASLQGANYHPINWCDGEIYITFMSSISYFSKNTLRGVYGVWTFQGLTSTEQELAVMVHIGHVHHANGAKEFANAQQAEEDLKICKFGLPQGSINLLEINSAHLL